MDFKNLKVTVPQSLQDAMDTKSISEGIFMLLNEIDEQVGGVAPDNARRKLVENTITESFEVIDKEIAGGKKISDQLINILLITPLNMAWGAGIEGEESQGQPMNEGKEMPNIPHEPIHIPRDFGVLRRLHANFIKQDSEQFNIVGQPFIPRSHEQASIDFVAEYFRYCGNPCNYPGTEVKSIGYNEERFDVTPKVLENISKKIGVDFSTLKVYPFFQKLERYKRLRIPGSDRSQDINYRPSHDLLCHMLFMSPMANVPMYLSSGHLGDPEKNAGHFDYYTNFLLHSSPNTIPNQEGVIKLLKALIITLKKQRGRLMEIEISIDELRPILREQNIRPFELYESLIREQLRLVNNITTGKTIGFKLTPTGAMFLYMCCPNLF